MTKATARLRRSRKARARIKQQGAVRLTVHRSGKNIYAQIIQQQDEHCITLAAASTLENELKAELTGKKADQAKLIGKKIAERAKEKGIKKVAFDRSGYLYHGRVKALAEGAREGGLDF